MELNDTSPEVEEMQIRMLRRASTAQRFARARSLTNTVIHLSRQAIGRNQPALSDREIKLEFISLHYGKELAMSDSDIITSIKPLIAIFEKLGIPYLETMLKVDVFVLKKRDYDQQAFERKLKDHLDAENPETTFFLAAPEDIVLNKLEWYLAGGEVSRRQWEDVIGVLRVQSDKINLQYLQTWAKKLGINGHLEKAIKEAHVIL